MFRLGSDGSVQFLSPQHGLHKGFSVCQQFREKRGVRREPIQRACHAISSGQTFSAEREEAMVFGVQSACGRHACGHAAAIQINSGALLSWWEESMVFMICDLWAICPVITQVAVKGKKKKKTSFLLWSLVWDPEKQNYSPSWGSRSCFLLLLQVLA